MTRMLAVAVWLLLVGMTAGIWLAREWLAGRSRIEVGHERQEVVFWHFWGGADRAIVEDIVARFNRSQQEHFVRAVAMPGNNLDLKVFLSVAGGRPPDLINQDDPILADWSLRGALLPLDSVASAEELQQLDNWLFPAAAELCRYEGRYYGLCNGLDIRALYYNQTWLDEEGLPPPITLDQLDHLADRLTERDPKGRIVRFGYVPDPRRLWAWGTVFGGDFYNPQTGEVTPADPPIVAALEWMGSYRKRFGARALAAFRQGDQSLPGSAFPLFPSDTGVRGRYAVIMDGQWRVRDIAEWQDERQRQGLPVVRFGVTPLPAPPGGRAAAGWVNGNFFLIPRGAANTAGAWAFMKFWSGFGGHEAEAADACAAGGWIPASNQVARQPAYQAMLEQRPLLRPFVTLAESPAQHPIPVIPAAALYDRTLRGAATTMLYDERSAGARELLEEVRRRVQPALDRARAAVELAEQLPQGEGAP